MLDVYSVKQNICLVLEFLDTDLEAVIKDKTLIFQNADIKSWMAMSLRGLEYIHRSGVLHRVSRNFYTGTLRFLTRPIGFETEQLANSVQWRAEDR